MKSLASVFTTFVLTIGLFAGTALAQRDPGFDPFAAPPKNLQGADSGFSYAQNVDGIVVEEETTPAIGKVDDTHYTGVLEESDRAVDDYFTYTLNIGEGKEVPLNVKSNLTHLIGEKVTIEIARTDAGIRLIGMTIHSTGITMSMMEGGDLHTAPTGPAAWILIPFVLLVLAALVGSGVFTRLGIFTSRKND